MTHCPVHVIKLPACPHTNPADTYKTRRSDEEAQPSGTTERK